MRRWVLLFGGLTIWAAHFFLLYAFASIFPDQQIANVLTWVATVPALAADAALLWITAARRLSAAGDELDQWLLTVGALGAALSFIAVLWQALPAAIF